MQCRYATEDEELDEILNHGSLLLGYTSLRDKEAVGGSSTASLNEARKKFLHENKLLYRLYLNDGKPDLFEKNSISAISNTSALHENDKGACPNCNESSRAVLNAADTMIHCLKCGVVYGYVCQSSIVRERECKNAFGTRRTQLDEWLSTTCSHTDSAKVPDSVMEVVHKALVEDRLMSEDGMILEDMDTLTPKLIRSILKKNGLTKYSSLTFEVIGRLTHGTSPGFNPKHVYMIRSAHNVISKAYDKTKYQLVKDNSGESGGRLCSHGYILSRIVMNIDPELRVTIALQNITRRNQYEHLWKTVADRAGFKSIQ